MDEGRRQVPRLWGLAGRIWGIQVFRQGKDTVMNYSKNQKEHHKSENFYDEFKRLLIENEIEFDEKYLL